MKDFGWEVVINVCYTVGSIGLTMGDPSPLRTKILPIRNSYQFKVYVDDNKVFTLIFSIEFTDIYHRISAC